MIIIIIIICFHWRLFGPITWKKGISRTLIRGAYTGCSNDNLLQKELHNIGKCFTEINCYPKWLLKQTHDSFKTSRKGYNKNVNNRDNNDMNINNLPEKIVHNFKVPYNNDHGNNIIKSIQASAKKPLPENHDVKIILTGTKLISQFSMKDDSNKQHKHDLLYFSRCPPTNCTDSYIGETARGLSERVMHHAGRDTKPHIIGHCLNSNYETVKIEHFKTLNLQFNNNVYTRRISEELFVKQYHPFLKLQENSVPLELFNLI